MTMMMMMSLLKKILNKKYEYWKFWKKNLKNPEYMWDSFASKRPLQLTVITILMLILANPIFFQIVPIRSRQFHLTTVRLKYFQVVPVPSRWFQLDQWFRVVLARSSFPRFIIYTLDATFNKIAYSQQTQRRCKNVLILVSKTS